MFIRKLATAGALWAAGTVAAQAVPVSIGGYWVETDQAVGTVAQTSGKFSTVGSLSPLVTGLGDNWGGGGLALSFDEPTPYSGAPYPNAVVQGTFKNAVTNGAGYDIFAFEQGSAPAIVSGNNTALELISASTTGGVPWLNLTVLDFLAADQVGGSGTTTGLYVLALDLSDLGIGDGATISSLFFGNTLEPDLGSSTNHDPDILYMAGVAPVPLPAALPLLASGLGAVGLIGWRRRRAEALT